MEGWQLPSSTRVTGQRMLVVSLACRWLRPIQDRLIWEAGKSKREVAMATFPEASGPRQAPDELLLLLKIALESPHEPSEPSGAYA